MGAHERSLGSPERARTRVQHRVGMCADVCVAHSFDTPDLLRCWYERLPPYIPASLPRYLPASLPPYPLPTSLTSLPPYLPTSLPPYLPYLPICLDTSSTYLLHLPTHNHHHQGSGRPPPCPLRQRTGTLIPHLTTPPLALSRGRPCCQFLLWRCCCLGGLNVGFGSPPLPAGQIAGSAGKSASGQAAASHRPAIGQPSVRRLEVCPRRCALAGVSFSMLSLG